MNIIYFSPIPWDELKQRPQHIAEGLSIYNNVYYIEPSVSLFKSLKDNNYLYRYREITVNNNLKIIRPSGKWRFPKSFEVFDLLGINSLLERIQIKKVAQKCNIIWLGNPVYFSMFKNEKAKIIVYDKMDDYAHLTDGRLLKKVICDNERKLILRADLIFTTSQLFYNQIKNYNNKIYIVNNGTESYDYNIIKQKNIIVEDIKRLKNNGATIFGYIGTISNWFDYSAIEDIINYDFNFHIVIVGLNKLPTIGSERVHYYKPVEKGQIPEIIDAFDYCLYNFKMDNFLDTIDPVKLYEYLGRNKKVISVRSIETERFKDLVNLYSSYEELKQILNNLGNISEPFKMQEDLYRFIHKNNWQNRVDNINNKLQELYTGR